MSDIDRQIKELEAKRAAKQDAEEEARKAQYLIDLAARIELEEEHGHVTAVKLSRFVKGVPTMALVRAPSKPEYSRFKGMHASAANSKNAAKGRIDALEMLGNACWVYPAEEKRDAMLGVATGLVVNIGNAALALAEGREEDEGKG